MNDYTKNPEAGAERATTPTEASDSFLERLSRKIMVGVLGVGTIEFGALTVLSIFGGSIIESIFIKAGNPPGILSQYPIEAVAFGITTGFLGTLTSIASSGKTPEKTT